MAPLAHADAADAHTPASSSRNSNASDSMSAMQTCAEPATLYSAGTVSTTPSTRSCEPRDERVAEDRQAGVLVGPLAIGEVECNSGGDDAGGVVGAAAALALLPTADDQRIDFGAAAFDEYPDAFRPAELVGAERQQVDVGGDVAQVEPTGGLDRIGVQQRIGSVTTHDPGDVGDVGDGADLVVDRHHADDRHIGGGIEHGREFVEVDAPDGVDADHATLGRQLFDDVQHGVVLDGRADGDAAAPSDRPRDRHVVALGPAAGEHDLVGVAPDHAGNDVAGLVDGLAALAGRTGETPTGWRTARTGTASSPRPPRRAWASTQRGRGR